MDEKFLENLSDITYGDADLLAKDIAIAKSLGDPSEYVAPVNKLADPFNVEELLEGPVAQSNKALITYVDRTDGLYDQLAEITNFIIADIQVAEDRVSKFTKQYTAKANINSSWFGDSFSTKENTNIEETTCAVDTKFGILSLPLAAASVFTDYTLELDTDLLNGIPGCNMLVTNPTKFTNIDSEPEVSIEEESTTSLLSLVDQNSTTSFELERNFVLSKQGVFRVGRSYIYSGASSSLDDVLSITRNFDWTTEVKYKEQITRKPLAEIIDSAPTDQRAVLSLVYTFNTPTTISGIKLAAIERFGLPEYTIDSLYGIDEQGTKFLIVEDLRISGRANDEGYLLPIRISKLFTKLFLTVSAGVKEAPHGLAHKFKEIEQDKRTERKYALFSSVDRRKTWDRVELNSVPISTSFEVKQPSLIGAGVHNNILELLAASTYISTYNKYLDSRIKQNDKKNSNQSNISNSIVDLSKDIEKLKIGGDVGRAAGFINQVAPTINLALGANQLIQTLFSTNKTVRLIGEIVGYDVFKGWRAALKFRDISLFKEVYKSTGTYVSKFFKFKENITQIKLNAEYVLPDWGTDDSIKFFVSTDGVVWKRIVPKEWIALSSGTTSLQIKIELTGSTADPMKSPLVYSYYLEAY